VKAEAEAMRDAIAAGTYHPFTGPINKQDGSAWLAEGAGGPDGDLLGHEFLCRRHHRRHPAVKAAECGNLRHVSPQTSPFPPRVPVALSAA
jgi:hypothetical protein